MMTNTYFVLMFMLMYVPFLIIYCLENIHVDNQYKIHASVVNKLGHNVVFKSSGLYRKKVQVYTCEK